MGILSGRKWEVDEKVKATPEGGVLAVWGTPGCGKTVVAAKIAENLCKRGEDVILVLADMTTPPMPYLCPPSDLIGEGSLGSILAAARVNDVLVRRNCVLTKKNRHLSLVGFRRGENRFTYPPYADEQAKGLIAAAREVAPFVIVDCSGHVTTNRLTAIALMEADAVIRLTSCDLKGVSYLASQLPLLADPKWNADAHVRAASDVKPGEASGGIEQVLGKVPYRIPHSKEVETQFLEGNLLKELCYKESRPFRAAIDELATEALK